MSRPTHLAPTSSGTHLCALAWQVPPPPSLAPAPAPSAELPAGLDALPKAQPETDKTLGDEVRPLTPQILECVPTGPNFAGVKVAAPSKGFPALDCNKLAAEFSDRSVGHADADCLCVCCRATRSRWCRRRQCSTKPCRSSSPQARSRRRQRPARRSRCRRRRRQRSRSRPWNMRRRPKCRTLPHRWVPAPFSVDMVHGPQEDF